MRRCQVLATKAFDPAFHEALTTVPAASKDEDHLIAQGIDMYFSHHEAPLATLERGYALVLRGDGTVATSVASLADNEQVTLRMRDGQRLVLSVTHSLRHLHLYDSVTVLRAGSVLYSGPSEHLLEYFNVSNAEELFLQLLIIGTS